MRKFIIFLFIQVFILVYIAISHYSVEWYGDEVRLKTAPVDPRDIFYGDYVILNYDISELNIDKFVGDKQPERGDTIYVVLRKEGEYHDVISAHLGKPSTSAEERVLKGRVEYVTRHWDPTNRENQEIQYIRVVYGFERYYVSEGTGKELEDRRGQFDVVVKVTPWGQSLTEIHFIANGVITQWEVQEKVYEYYSRQGKAVHITNSQLTAEDVKHNRPVWLVEMINYPEKGNEQLAKTMIIVVDAITGDILEEKAK
ncbi:GDYXXLXY domain-containing protein [Ammoniphilus sp. CFH 90114]|uniref:GDYXXLXY domain-containing protein n=1 Tax=Ammoniphilus sp. CFH 90114 TaxID=2493665 RepID=UPI00100F3142|nr:GDYXXLXY domain-containing protein [Ammoniphilus sp. CFH 90114]RXT06431.1 hypothetical protein EIZ39_15285 [Ammoniphilus sp. CFH 90114]